MYKCLNGTYQGNCKQLHKHVCRKPDPKNRQQFANPPLSSVQLSANLHSETLTSPNNLAGLSRVTYAYNWLSDVSAPYLNSAAPPLHFPTPHHTLPPSPPTEAEQGSLCFSYPSRSKDSRPRTATDTDVHGFAISPRAAGLPFPTGFTHARQSRHWRAGLETSSRTLRLFADSADMGAAVRAHGGRSLAGVAAAELRRPEEDRFTKFATYLFPGADEARMRLVSAAIVFIIVFDGVFVLCFLVVVCVLMLVQIRGRCMKRERYV